MNVQNVFGPSHETVNQYPYYDKENFNGGYGHSNFPKGNSDAFANRTIQGNPFTCGNQTANELNYSFWAVSQQHHQPYEIPLYPSTTLYVRNIRPTTDEVALWREFTMYGSIIACKVLRNNDGSSRCAGFVQFSCRKEAETALAACKSRMGDKTSPKIRASWAERPLHLSIATGSGGMCTIAALQSLPLHPAYRATINQWQASNGCNFVQYHRFPYNTAAAYMSSYGVPTSLQHPNQHQYHHHQHHQQQQHHETSASTYEAPSATLSSEEKKAICDRVKKAADSITKSSCSSQNAPRAAAAAAAAAADAIVVEKKVSPNTSTISQITTPEISEDDNDSPHHSEEDEEISSLAANLKSVCLA